MNRKTAPEGYYTAKEAMTIIDIPVSSFHNLVRGETLHRVMFPGRKEGVYSQVEIDDYARSIKAFNQFNTNRGFDFGLALIEDLPCIHKLVASVSGGYAHAVPVDILKAWIRKNPQSVHILRRQSEIVGYISMFPLQEDVLMQRLDGTLFNRSIPIDAIQRFNPNAKINLYIAEMAVKHDPAHLKNDEPDPDHPDREARKLGYRLISEAYRFVLSLERQNTHVERFYAVGTTQFGIQMCTDLGMDVMSLETGVRENRKPFKLDIAKQGEIKSPIVRRLVAA